MSSDASPSLPHIVVLGAGFAGLTFCKRFPAGIARITLVDRQNHHLFQPLLYQVATAGLAAPDIAQPIRAILRPRSHVTVLMAEVEAIDLATRRVTLDRETLSYDYLVIALGGRTSYFGHPEWEAFAPGLKSLEDALQIRRRILLAYEQAEMEPDEEVRRRLLTTIVVGAGPTGVEMAGTCAELARTALVRDFKRINPAGARVILIEGGPRVLATFTPELSARAQQQLAHLGVEVRTNTLVQAIRAGEVELQGETIAAANIIWAAGVGAVPLTRQLGLDTDRAGRLRVQPDLSLPGHPEVFAAGDLVALVDPKGVAVPGVAPAAMQMGKFLARLIATELRSGPARRERPSFQYVDKGSMATIGRSAAIAQLGRLHFSGFPAWLAWLTVHLLFLVGFRNRFSVFTQWVYSYFTYQRGARLITGQPPPTAQARPR